jgi:hypothetical protein
MRNMDKIYNNMRLLYRLSGLYIVIACLLGADPVSVLAVTVATGALYKLFVYQVTPALLVKNDPTGAATGEALGYQIANCGGFFLIVCLLALLGFDSDTLGISTAVLWHLQLILMVDLTKKGS